MPTAQMILVFNAEPGPYMTEEGKYTVNHAWGGLKPNDFAAICLRLANAMICLCTIPFLGLLKKYDKYCKHVTEILRSYPLE